MRLDKVYTNSKKAQLILVVEMFSVELNVSRYKRVHDLVMVELEHTCWADRWESASLRE